MHDVVGYLIVSVMGFALGYLLGHSSGSTSMLDRIDKMLEQLSDDE